jgi:hypothetical protein
MKKIENFLVQISGRPRPGHVYPVPCRFLPGIQPSDTWRCLSETTVEFPSPPPASDLQSFGFSFLARFFAKLRVCVRDSLLVRCKICGNWERCDFLGELHRLSLHGVFGGEILLSNSCRLIRRMILFCFAAQVLFVVGTLNLMRDEITLGLRFCGIRELRGFGWRLNSDVLFLFFKFMFSWKFEWKTCAVLWCFSFSAREFTPSWKFYGPAILKVSNLAVFSKVLRPGLPLNPSELLEEIGILKQDDLLKYCLLHDDLCWLRHVSV